MEDRDAQAWWGAMGHYEWQLVENLRHARALMKLLAHLAKNPRKMLGRASRMETAGGLLHSFPVCNSV
jgi:hypothetical protein